MGAPVFNTHYVGTGTKRAMACKPHGFDGVYSRYKSMEGRAKQAYEMGAGLYGAYQFGRQAYPYIRAGVQAAMA